MVYRKGMGGNVALVCPLFFYKGIVSYSTPGVIREGRSRRSLLSGCCDCGDNRGNVTNSVLSCGPQNENVPCGKGWHHLMRLAW